MIRISIFCRTTGGAAVREDEGPHSAQRGKKSVCVVELISSPDFYFLWRVFVVVFTIFIVAAGCCSVKPQNIIIIFFDRFFLYLGPPIVGPPESTDHGIKNVGSFSGSM